MPVTPLWSAEIGILARSTVETFRFYYDDDNEYEVCLQVLSEVRTQKGYIPGSFISLFVSDQIDAE